MQTLDDGTSQLSLPFNNVEATKTTFKNKINTKITTLYEVNKNKGMRVPLIIYTNKTKNAEKESQISTYSCLYI